MSEDDRPVIRILPRDRERDAAEEARAERVFKAGESFWRLGGYDDSLGGYDALRWMDQFIARSKRSKK